MSKGIKKVGPTFPALFLCLSLSTLTGLGQQVSDLIKVENFAWYYERQADKPNKIRRYPFGLPEGKSMNFPDPDESRQKSTDKFIYRIRVLNLSDREIGDLEWRYDFVNPLTKEIAASHRFWSPIRIKPKRRKMVSAEGSSPPTTTVPAGLFRLNKDHPYLETATVISLTLREKGSRPGVRHN